MNKKLPSFPQFTFLSLSLKKQIEELTSKYAPYSDYNFTSLFSYDTKNDFLFSQLKGNLVIRFRDYISLEPFYSVLGENKITETVSALLADAHLQGYEACLKLVPEPVVRALRKEKGSFKITEDRDNYDYVYELNDLSKLQGGKYYEKRKVVNRFHRKYLGNTTSILDLTDPVFQKEILALFDKWVVSRSKSKVETTTEKTALTRLLANSDKMPVIGIGKYYNDSLIGFLIGEEPVNSYASFHFSKYEPLYTGSFEALLSSSAAYFVDKGAKYVNLEQDFGMKGLRHSKEKWKPSFFLKKYTITEKSTRK